MGGSLLSRNFLSQGSSGAQFRHLPSAPWRQLEEEGGRGEGGREGGRQLSMQSSMSQGPTAHVNVSLSIWYTLQGGWDQSKEGPGMIERIKKISVGKFIYALLDRGTRLWYINPFV